MRRLPLIHPGEVLEEEFLKPMGVSRYRLAKATGVSSTRVGEIVRGTRAISAETALRLGAVFGTTPQFWMALQSEYDLRRAAAKFGPRIEKEVEPLASLPRRGSGLLPRVKRSGTRGKRLG